MENLALIDSFSDFKDEKLIDRVTLMVILEEVFRNTLKRKYGSDENFDIIINPDKGDLEIWRNRVVVKDGEVEDSNQEIELSEAQKIEADFEVGYKDFGNASYDDQWFFNLTFNFNKMNPNTSFISDEAFERVSMKEKKYEKVRRENLIVKSKSFSVKAGGF